MNQNQTPQRPQNNNSGVPGYPPRRQPQEQKAKRNGVFIGLLTGTIVLLVISLIVLCVIMAMGGFDEKKPSGNDRENGGAANQQSQQGTDSDTKPPVKAKFLTLPSATATGNYRATTSSNTQEITGIQSEAAIVVTMDGKISVGEKNADARIYPASMTKVMTLLVACENAKSATDELTVTQDMMEYLYEHQDASVWGALKKGSTLTVEDALFLINYQSDTIACLLIAEYIAGSEEAFVQMMNDRARQLGCSEETTHFVNSTGLHDDNHYTTCRDMATIMCAAMNNPAAKKVLTSYEGYSIDGIATGKFYASWFSNPGRLADNKWVGGGSDMAFIAGKTGYEDIPTSCFVTAAENTETGKRYVCVTVGRLNEDSKLVTNAESTKDVKYIYRYYANGETDATR